LLLLYREFLCRNLTVMKSGAKFYYFRWMADVIGYDPKACAGNLTSGGSIATLIALVTARESFKLKAKDFDKCVIYVSEEAHNCIDKAIWICGMREAILRKIPVDDDLKMDVAELKLAIEMDRGDKLKPFFLMANAGTTNSGKTLYPINSLTL